MTESPNHLLSIRSIKVRTIKWIHISPNGGHFEPTQMIFVQKMNGKEEFQGQV